MAIKSQIKYWFQRIKCYYGYHVVEYLPPPHGIMGGIFAPYRCRCCGHESKGFPYPFPVEPLNEVCEHGCHIDITYGFVVMAGCPIHD